MVLIIYFFFISSCCNPRCWLVLFSFCRLEYRHLESRVPFLRWPAEMDRNPLNPPGLQANPFSLPHTVPSAAPPSSHVPFDARLQRNIPGVILWTLDWNHRKTVRPALAYERAPTLSVSGRASAFTVRGTWATVWISSRRTPLARTRFREPGPSPSPCVPWSSLPLLWCRDTARSPEH